MMNAAIPRTRKMMKRNQMRPIPHIIVIGKSVICIMVERPIHLRNRAQEPDKRNCIALAPMTTGVVRRCAASISAKHVVLGNLFRRQQCALRQVGLQVNRPKLALQGRDCTDLRRKRCRLDCAVRKGAIKGPLGLDDLAADG